MKLIDEWRTVLRKAWSIRLILIAGLLSGLEYALPYLSDLPIPRGVCALLSMVVTGAALVARVLAQKDSDGK